MMGERLARGRYTRIALMVAMAAAMMLFAACMSSASSSSSSEGSSSSVSAPSKELRLSNDDDRVLLNRRLSWMAQAFDYGGPEFDLSDVNNQVRFAIIYLRLAESDAWEFGDYTDIVGPGTAADGSTNVRVEADAVDSVVKDYFDVAPDYSALDGAYKHNGDYVYFSVTAPPGQSAFYSAATELQLLDDGRYSVAFETYTGSMPYLEYGDDFFAEKGADMKDQLEGSHVLGKGEAVIRVSELDGEASIIFESYKAGIPSPGVSDAISSKEEKSEAAATVITTPYYTITIPPDWPKGRKGQIAYTVDEQLKYLEGTPLHGIGCTTEVNIDGDKYDVTCFTDNWGVQGDSVAELVGTPGNLPGWRVIAYILTKSQEDDAKANGKYTAMLEEFMSFITLAPADGGPENASGGSQSGSGQSGQQSDAALRKAEFDERFANIKAAKASDYRMGNTTMDMLAAGNEYCGKYEELINDVLDFLYSIPSVDAASLKASQETWQSDTEIRVQNAADEFRGGSLMGVAANGERLQAYEERLTKLIGMIPT